MKIEMLKTMLGSPDGVTVHRYEEGMGYEEGPMLSTELAEVFVKNKWAKEVKDAPESKEPKSVKGAPENKALGTEGAEKGQA